MDHIHNAKQKLVEYQRDGLPLAPWRSQLIAEFKRMWRREIKSSGKDRLNHLDIMALVLPTISIPLSCVRISCGPFEFWLNGNCKHTYQQRVNEVNQGKTAVWAPFVVEELGCKEYRLWDGHHRYWALTNYGPSDSMVNVVVIAVE